MDSCQEYRKSLPPKHKAINTAVKIGVLSLILMATNGCNSDSVSGPTEGRQSFSYQTVNSLDLQKINAIVGQRNYQVGQVERVSVQQIPSRVYQQQEMHLYRYLLDNSVRYGAVIYPPNYQGLSLPVALVLSGLDQSDPEVKVKQLLIDYQYFAPQLSEFIMVVPSFRGNHFELDFDYLSQGDFCDAYDGAATDAISLLNLVEQFIPEANMNAVLVTGGSRGGNVAHIVGQRDSRVSMVIAMAGPTDFYRKTVENHYKEQFQCQFFDNKTAEQAREKMLLSSPLHFANNSPTTRIHHAKKDKIVPLWHATEIYQELMNNNKDVMFYQYDSGSHNNFYIKDDKFIANFENNIVEFLSSIVE